MAKRKRKRSVCTITDFGGGHVIVNGKCSSKKALSRAVKVAGRARAGRHLKRKKR